ncbi:MAG TPA: PAS domain-containing protein [Candidatus Solibacter sp.]|nr:PAS domain-containing protein [Candidatus Solibacter sp.]
MELQVKDPEYEIQRLQRCVNDLVSLLALPAVWSGREPSQIVEILLDALLKMLTLDFIHVRLNDPVTQPATDLLRTADSYKWRASPEEIREIVSEWIQGDFVRTPPTLRTRLGNKDVSLFPIPLGLQGEFGVMTVASDRLDFPGQTESLLLSVAANQASIGLGEARLLAEQKRIANELERRVAERTTGLAKTNEELKNEIVARKKVEERLLQSEAALQSAFDEIRKSEAKLRRVIDTIPTLAWCNLADGPNEFLSRRWHEYTGLSPEESHGWGWQVAFHPEDLPALMKTWQELLVSGQPGEIEARLRRYDGTYRWFLIRVEPFRDETGKLDRWYGTSTDIEDRKQAEHALQSSQRNLSSIINTMPTFAWSARPDGSADFLNDQWLQYAGLSAEQALDWKWLAAIHPDDLNHLTDYWRSIMVSGEPGEIEVRIRRFDGDYRWFLIRANAVRDEAGAIVKWYGTNTDIDDRKRAEARSEEAYLRLAEAQQLSKTGSFITDLLADNHDWSEEAFRIFEFDPSTKVTVQMIRDIVHPEDLPTFDAVIARGMSGTDVDFVFRIVLPRGAVKHIRGMARVMMQVGGHPLFIGALQDVTESKAAEAALDRARSELAHVSRVSTLNALTASVAHEINQPLSGIITNAGTCLRMLNGDPPNVDGARETARRTLRDGNRASDVISRLRTLYSRKELTLELVDLNEAMREVIALSLGDLQRNKVVLRSELADDLPPVIGDRIQLQQVMMNLFRNASDAMISVEDRPRQLLIRTRREEDHRVRLDVQDAGIGVNPQELERLFEAFYTTKVGGMGIGLSVCHSIIEKHQGRLWAEPNNGPGATFSFSIPCSSTGPSAPASV